MTTEITLDDGTTITLGKVIAYDYRGFDGDRCPVCDEPQHGSSHYHCGNCLEKCSMYGHYDWSNDAFTCDPLDKT